MIAIVVAVVAATRSAACNSVEDHTSCNSLRLYMAEQLSGSDFCKLSNEEVKQTVLVGGGSDHTIDLGDLVIQDGQLAYTSPQDGETRLFSGTSPTLYRSNSVVYTYRLTGGLIDAEISVSTLGINAEKRKDYVLIRVYASAAVPSFTLDVSGVPTLTTPSLTFAVKTYKLGDGFDYAPNEVTIAAYCPGECPAECPTDFDNTVDVAFSSECDATCVATVCALATVAWSRDKLLETNPLKCEQTRLLRRRRQSGVDTLTITTPPPYKEIVLVNLANALNDGNLPGTGIASTNNAATDESDETMSTPWLVTIALVSAAAAAVIVYVFPTVHAGVAQRWHRVPSNEESGRTNEETGRSWT